MIDTSHHHASCLNPIPGHADLLSGRETFGGAGMCGEHPLATRHGKPMISQVK